MTACWFTLCWLRMGSQNVPTSQNFLFKMNDENIKALQFWPKWTALLTVWRQSIDGWIVKGSSPSLPPCLPLRDLSTENLRFLSSRQALADLAHFRTAMAEARGLATSQWVAFGGSYPGSLATWFRLKYPHLVDAAVASSAPVHATVNFPGRTRVVLRFPHHPTSIDKQHTSTDSGTVVPVGEALQETGKCCSIWGQFRRLYHHYILKPPNSTW